MRELEDGRTLLYIDRHLVHEVTSPQAFEGLRLAGRKVRRPDLTFATVDHNVPTTARHLPIADPLARQQVETLRDNASAFGVPLFDFDSGRQGIVHVIGPELGLTLPGMTIVCGDSHTSTHGAFGALAFGIGTSEVEHVLATQCLAQQKPKAMRITLTGSLSQGVTAKDVALALMGRLGVSGRLGIRARNRRAADRHAVDGTAHDDLQHEHRGRRAQRAHRARCHDVCVPRRPAARAEGRRMDRRRSRTGTRSPAIAMRTSTPKSRSTSPRSPRS